MPNPRARELRKNLTDAERRLWAQLRLRQTGGHKFRRQRPIGPYIVDFVCLQRRLVIEVDGGQHMQGAAHDSRRDVWLASLGFRVLRFWDNQVLNEMEAVTEVIAAALGVSEGPPSSPSAADEGRNSHPHPDLPPPSGGRSAPWLSLAGGRGKEPRPSPADEGRNSHPHPDLPPPSGGRKEPRPSPADEGRNSHPHPDLPPLGGGRKEPSPLPRRWGRVGEGGEKGQVLLLAVILLAAGTMMVTPLLSQLATALQKGGSEREQRMKVYAVEAAINRVIADLIRGADGVGTTYTTQEPHTGGTFQTFTITTAYTAPSITVNGYTPTVTIALPTGTQAKPTTQQNYVDPGVTHPGLASIPGGQAYLVRLYNVKAGTLQINWAYSPAGTSRMAVWAGIPVDNSTGLPFPPGALAAAPKLPPILDTGSTPSTATSNRSAAVTVDPATDGSGGVYTIVFDNKATGTKTTAAFAASGGPNDTWIYVKAQKDYEITASVGGVSVSTYVRQVPGYAEPPAVSLVSGTSYSYTFATNNVSFITNDLFAYTWNSP